MTGMTKKSVESGFAKIVAIAMVRRTGDICVVRAVQTARDLTRMLVQDVGEVVT